VTLTAEPSLVDVDPEPARRVPGAAVLALVVAGLVALHLVLSRSMDGFLLADGTGYLANARWIVGKAGTTWQGPAAFYNAGWSLVVAPIYLFTRSPAAVHSGVLLVNAVLASLSFVAYAALAERVFGLRRSLAVLAGLVAATYPAVLLQASFEWSESLFHLLFPLLLLAVDRLLRTRTPAAAAVVAVLAGALNATHPKGLGALVAVGIGLVVLGITRHLPVRTAVTGLAMVVVVFAAVRVLHGALQDALYAKSAAAIEGDVLGRISDPTLVWGSFKRLWGQLWYLTVASVGLFPLGVWVVARHRDRRYAAMTLGICLAILAASCLQMSDGTRVDHMVYGRYDEGFLPALLVAGAAGLVVHRDRILRLAAVGAALSGGLGVLAVALNGGGHFSGDVMPLNVVGILVYRGDVDAVDVRTVTLLALLPLLAVALVAWRRAAAGALVAVAFFVGSSLSVEARTIRPWEDFWSSVTAIPDVVHDLGFHGPVGYDMAAYDVDAADLYQLELTDVGDLLFFDSGKSTHLPGTDLVIASPQWDLPGARLAFVESGPHHQALWVLPGRLQDDLDARGELLPAEHSAPLDADAQRAALTVDVRRLGLERGETRTVSVHVEDRGAPWLPVGPVPGVVNGAVRLGARWFDAGGGVVASQTTELPRVLRRGDAVDVPLDLVADVEPGTYRVEISLRQEGIAYWDASAVTIEVTVR
jgi:hypothetical protein